MKTVSFLGYTCRADFGRYPNGRPALVLKDAVTGELVAKASVNVPDYEVPAGHVLVKDWNENHGVLGALVRGGIVEDTGRTVPCGWVDAHLCRLLVAA